MIEISTGVVFLLSSMYGSTALTAQATAADITTSNISEDKAVITIQDRKIVENYVKEEFADTPILVEVARCESTFSHYGKNGEVIRGRVDNADVGVMQINERYHLETSKKLGFDIHTIEGNVDYAQYLYDKQGTAPWKASKPCWGSKELSINK